jgi:hypothetical protein
VESRQTKCVTIWESNLHSKKEHWEATSMQSTRSGKSYGGHTSGEKGNNIRSLAVALGIPRTTAHRFKMGQGRDMSLIRPHPNTIKPYLEDVHLSARVHYTRSKIHLSTGLHDGFYQSVHVDENVFLRPESNLFCIYLSLKWRWVKFRYDR